MTQEENTQVNKKKSGLKKYLRFFFVIFLILFVYGVGYDRGKNVGQAIGDSADMSLYWRVRSELMNKYVDSEKLDQEKMLYGSISGLLYSTGDPYTMFFDAKQNKEFNQEIEGNFEGIGAELGVKNGMLMIIAPIEGAPAEKAGLRAGDRIVSIDGNLTSDITLDEAVGKIRGNKGTDVTLTIFREGNEETFEVIVKRDIINVKSVKYEVREGNIAYIKISRFGDDTADDFSLAVSKAKSAGVKGIILDLRNNPGGYLTSAIDIASEMLPKGKTVLIEEDANKKQDKMYAKGGDVVSGVETIILINEGSASASEILAGALNENRDNVTLLGKKTFGKGSVQELISLPEGTALKVTIARWLTPNGNQINEKGIDPEVEIDLTNDDYDNNKDPQLDKALEIMKGEISK